MRNISTGAGVNMKKRYERIQFDVIELPIDVNLLEASAGIDNDGEYKWL